MLISVNIYRTCAKHVELSVPGDKGFDHPISSPTLEEQKDKSGQCAF